MRRGQLNDKEYHHQHLQQVGEYERDSFRSNHMTHNKQSHYLIKIYIYMMQCITSPGEKWLLNYLHNQIIGSLLIYESWKWASLIFLFRVNNCPPWTKAAAVFPFPHHIINNYYYYYCGSLFQSTANNGLWFFFFLENPYLNFQSYLLNHPTSRRLKKNPAVGT